MTKDTSWADGLARLDGLLARLHEQSDELAAANFRMADDTEAMRRRLQGRTDALKRARPRRRNDGNDGNDEEKN
jgi:hypothetical protein